MRGALEVLRPEVGAVQTSNCSPSILSTTLTLFIFCLKNCFLGRGKTLNIIRKSHDGWIGLRIHEWTQKGSHLPYRLSVPINLYTHIRLHCDCITRDYRTRVSSTPKPNLQIHVFRIWRKCTLYEVTTPAANNVKKLDNLSSWLDRIEGTADSN